MSTATQSYRRLSSWHGLFSGAALFRDEHCLISVRSSIFEEHVKRLQFKDIKAIVVSRSHRFGPSRRWILIALLLLITQSIFGRLLPSPLGTLLWTLLLALVIAWLYTSMKTSCRCLVYTAVSQEELPSVRRYWAARTLQVELAPLIESAQEAFPEGWKTSMANATPLVVTQAPVKSGESAIPAERTGSQAGRLTASSLLVAFLLLDVLLTTWDLQRTLPLPNWIGAVLGLVEAAAAVWVLMQNRGIDSSLQRLGAAVLIFLGLAFYAESGTVAFAQFSAQARTKRQLQEADIHANPMHRTVEEIYVGGCLVFGILGAFLTLAGPGPRRQRTVGD